MEYPIGSFDTRKGHEQVRVYVVNDNGKPLVSTRMYDYKPSKCNWTLSKKGVTIRGTQVYKLTKLQEKAAEFISSEKFQKTTS